MSSLSQTIIIVSLLSVCFWVCFYHSLNCPYYDLQPGEFDVSFVPTLTQIIVLDVTQLAL